jgi:hypothetical protein
MTLFPRLIPLLSLFTGSALAAPPSFTFTTISYPGALSTTATGINNAGQVIGYYGGQPFLEPTA